jgi:hypothetical protein
MAKTAKFFICENPMVDDGRVFVLHNRAPRVLAEAFHFEPEDVEDWMDCKRQFPVGASVDYPGELIVVGAIWIEAGGIDANRIAKIMSRMGDWYYAYLDWEDAEIPADGE